MIKCNPFIVFLVNLEGVKGVFYSPRQRPKVHIRKNQFRARIKVFVTLTPSLTDQDF